MLLSLPSFKSAFTCSLTCSIILSLSRLVCRNFLFRCYRLSTASQAQSSLSGLLHSVGPAERGWSQGTDLLDKISDNLGKARAFSRRNPFEDKPLRIDSRKLKELFHESHSFHRHVITVQVMAVPDVSAPHKDAVRPFLKGLQYLMRPDSCGTQRPDGPHVGGILQSAHSRQVRAGVRAPVAEKADYRRFKLFVGHFLSPSNHPARACSI